MMLTYWKPIAVIGFIILIFLAGWHYESLRISAKELKQTDIDIEQANKKIVNNNKVEANYDRTVTEIENSKTEVPNEKTGCTIPSGWLQLLRSATN